MKITHLLITASVIAFSAQAASAQGRKHHKKKSAERSAAREEFILDKKDTHGSQNEPGKDARPEDLGAYHKHTYSRIVSLAKAGSLTNDQATEFKLTHTEITNQIKTAKESDTLTAGKKTSIRKDLNDLNDTINTSVKAPDAGDKRTPVVNKAQHKYEEVIQFGERSGRLSKGEASRLRRKVDSLEKLEARYKAGSSLSTREREKIHEEMIEIRRDLHKELLD